MVSDLESNGGAGPHSNQPLVCDRALKASIRPQARGRRRCATTRCLIAPPPARSRKKTCLSSRSCCSVWQVLAAALPLSTCSEYKNGSCSHRHALPGRFLPATLPPHLASTPSQLACVKSAQAGPVSSPTLLTSTSTSPQRTSAGPSLIPAVPSTG